MPQILRQMIVIIKVLLLVSNSTFLNCERIKYIIRIMHALITMVKMILYIPKISVKPILIDIIFARLTHKDNKNKNKEEIINAFKELFIFFFFPYRKRNRKIKILSFTELMNFGKINNSLAY